MPVVVARKKAAAKSRNDRERTTRRACRSGRCSCSADRGAAGAARSARAWSGIGLLAGFRTGYGRIHHDEQRHIAYGIWYLRTAIAEAPELAGTLRETLRDLLPAVA